MFADGSLGVRRCCGARTSWFPCVLLCVLLGLVSLPCVGRLCAQLPPPPPRTAVLSCEKEPWAAGGGGGWPAFTSLDTGNGAHSGQNARQPLQRHAQSRHAHEVGAGRRAGSRLRPGPATPARARHSPLRPDTLTPNRRQHYPPEIPPSPYDLPLPSREAPMQTPESLDSGPRGKARKDQALDFGGPRVT